MLQGNDGVLFGWCSLTCHPLRNSSCCHHLVQNQESEFKMPEVFRFQDQAQPWGKKVLAKSHQIPVFQEFCAPVLEVKVCWSKALALYQRQSCLCHICWRWTIFPKPIALKTGRETKELCYFLIPLPRQWVCKEGI
jgi:hypothetical protein